MKKFFTTVIAVIVVCLCFLTGCGTTGLENNPAANLDAIGNGGLAVVKGDYLYYVNGYQDHTAFVDVKTDNKYGEIVRGAIYRTKLVNGKVVRNEDGMLEDTECVVSHTVGFDKGGFYIIGDYIYYLTPHMENAIDKTTGEKVLKSDWTDICRIKIDGTGQSRIAYTSSDERISDWAVYTVDNKAYIVLLDGTDLICVDGESGEIKTMASGVTSVALLKQENYVYGTDNLTDNYKYVYYTREYTENDGENGKAGNKLCKVLINSTSENLVACDLKYNYKLVSNINGSVYYTKTDDTGVEQHAKVFRRSIASNEEVEVCFDYSAYLILDNNNTNMLDNKVVYVDGNHRIILSVNGTKKVLYTTTADVTFVGENNGNVYYLEESKLYSLNYTSSEEVTPNLVLDEDKTYKMEDASLIDFDGRRIFVYAEYTSEDSSANYYLNIIDSYDAETDSDFVGKFADGETPEKPEEVENEDGEMEQPQWIR